MSSTAEKIAVACPQCGQQLLVPATALGKHGRCPSCKHVFPLEAAVQAESVEQPASTWENDASDLPLQAQSEQSASVNSVMPPVPPGAQVDKGKYNHGFGWEHRGWDKGAMGGLWMMAIGGIWFGVGLYLGRIFFYPVILFIIGLIGFFRGLFTGNLSGK